MSIVPGYNFVLDSSTDWSKAVPPSRRLQEQQPPEETDPGVLANREILGRAQFLNFPLPESGIPGLSPARQPRPRGGVAFEVDFGSPSPPASLSSASPNGGGGGASSSRRQPPSRRNHNQTPSSAVATPAAPALQQPQPQQSPPPRSGRKSLHNASPNRHAASSPSSTSLPETPARAPAHAPSGATSAAERLREIMSVSEATDEFHLESRVAEEQRRLAAFRRAREAQQQQTAAAAATGERNTTTPASPPPSSSPSSRMLLAVPPPPLPHPSSSSSAEASRESQSRNDGNATASAPAAAAAVAQTDESTFSRLFGDDASPPNPGGGGGGGGRGSSSAARRRGNTPPPSSVSPASRRSAGASQVRTAAQIAAAENGGGTGWQLNDFSFERLSLLDEGTVSTGLSQKQLQRYKSSPFNKKEWAEKFNKKLHQSGDDNNDDELECVVCMEVIRDGALTLTLACSHVFCGPCILEALSRRNHCPTCRMEIPRMSGT